MNQKKEGYDGAKPKKLIHEVELNGKTLRKGGLLTVHPRPGLIAGKWVFLHAEYLGSALQLTIEGPISREPRRRWIRESDVKIVHGRSRRARK